MAVTYNLGTQIHDWRTLVTVTAADETGRIVGLLMADLLDRGNAHFRNNFCECMKRLGKGVDQFQSRVFEPDGSLMKVHYEDPVRKGTGVFGNELSEGSFCIIDHLNVNRSWRRRGIGKGLVRKLLAPLIHCPFVFTWPAGQQKEVATVAKLYCENMHDVERRENAAAVAFWRGQGFRRVGLSVFFCLAADPNHRSRLLAAHNDAKYPWEERYADKDPVVLNDLRTAPSHLPLYNLDDGDALVVLQGLVQINNGPAILFNQKDAHGNTILHSAAENLKPYCLHYLIVGCLQLEHRTGWVTARNNHGMTPLDLLNINEETHRQLHAGSVESMERALHNGFEPFREKFMECKAILHGIYDDNGIRRLKAEDALGCNCDQCICGILSRRVKFDMRAQTDAAVMSMLASLHANRVVLPSLKSDAEQVRMFPELLFLPIELRERTLISANFKHAFVAILRYVIACLDNNVLPTVNAVANMAHVPLSGWNQSCEAYFRYGGRIEYVLDFVASIAHMGNDALRSRYRAHMATMTACFNDNSHTWLKRRMLSWADGGSLEDVSGPYYREAPPPAG